MPLYMDRHDAPGISPEELADLHTQDIEVQERHNVRYHTYWFDPANGSVFCPRKSRRSGPSKPYIRMHTALASPSSSLIRTSR
jgi:hypothetical protein